MVQISNKRLDDYISSKLSSLLFSLLGKKKNKETFESVIDSIFSSVEKIMILKRVGIIYLLLKGIKKFKIKSTLGVTTNTLDKYSLIIEKNPLVYNKFIKVIQKDKLTLFLEDFLNTLYGPGTPGVDWSSARKTQSLIKRKKEQGL